MCMGNEYLEVMEQGCAVSLGSRVLYSQFKCTQQSVDNLLQCKLTFLEMAYKLSDSFFFPIAKTLIITLHHLFAQKKSNDYFLVD